MRRTVRLPHDALVVLIGPAGCGKTTFAHARFRRTQVVSSDECRALVSDDAADPRASHDAFALMHFLIDKRLKRGRLTVADATNVMSHRRAEVLAIAKHHRRPIVAIVFDLPFDVCQERNRLRQDRRVPPQAIGGQFKAMREMLPHLAEEGFSEVHVLTSAEEAHAVRVHAEGRPAVPTGPSSHRSR